jgi:ribosomal-protein-alanine N-acetyltransferase
MSAAFVIRAASWRDFQPVLALERTCFGSETWPWFDVLAALTLPATLRFVAHADERIVGFIVGDRRRWEDLGWIATIGVDPAYRRRGIATSLLQTCEEALDVTRIRLTLRPSNEGAMRLYERAGYIMIDRWPKYYRGGEDGIVMEKGIRPAPGIPSSVS